VSVPSSELAPPTPSPASECVPPGTKGGATLACGLGGRGEPSDDWTQSLAICLLCALFVALWSLKYRLSRYFLKTSILPCSMRKCRHFKLVFSQLLSSILDISLECTTSTLEDITNVGNVGQLQLKIFDFERINIKLSANRINVFDAAAHFFAKSSFTVFSQFRVNP
jgi:hypothetical protein